MPRPSPTAYLIASVVTLALVVAGFVTLSIAGEDTGGLLGFVSPVLAALLVAGQVQVATAQQQARHSETVEQVQVVQDQVQQVAQISTELDQRIRELVKEGITEALGQLGVQPAQEVLPMRRATDRLPPVQGQVNSEPAD